MRLRAGVQNIIIRQGKLLDRLCKRVLRGYIYISVASAGLAWLDSATLKGTQN